MVGPNKKPLYVLDASVALKWVFDETEGKNAALLIRNDFIARKTSIIVTSQFFYEVVNIMAMKRPNDAIWFLGELQGLGVREYALSIEITSYALSIMKKCVKVSFYDASYHALAILNNGTFITADKKYFEKAKKFKHIKLLAGA